MKVTRSLFTLFMVAAGSLTVGQTGRAASAAQELGRSGPSLARGASPGYTFPQRHGGLLESNQNNAQFGYSVASAGDVNGDGYDDVVVGAYRYDNGETDEGRAFVYLGSASGPSSTPAWTAESDQDRAYFGFSVASAGDVNGDGYDDVVVGAYGYDNEQGRAYVYLGSASGLSSTPAWTAENNLAFGYSVASAGDVNGDGYDDVVVGAPLYYDGQTYEGWAYVYLGSASGPSSTPAWTAESDQTLAYFGFSVASAGDVNGDGYDDVVVGAPFYDHPGSDEGRAYVYLGSTSGPSPTPNWTAESDQNYANIGWSVASAGDVNGDGYDDVVVGAPSYTNGQTEEGRAFVYLGSPSGPSSNPVWTAESNQSYAYFSTSVASAGDVNGDGYDDVVVGAPDHSSGQAQEGRAYCYLGSPTGPSPTPTWTIESNQISALSGTSVASAGDVNGDGYDEVVDGAPQYDHGQTEEGVALIRRGSP